jgi:hypothetical protein
MDSRITVRFYTVVPSTFSQPNFEACLKKLMNLGANPARTVDDTVIQATNLAVNGDRISGDLVRIQDENFPSLVETKGVKPKKLVLASGAGLGHHAAFLYDKSIGILAYQIARNAVPLGRFNGYISAACECPIFGFLPVVSASELKQLNKMKPKTLLIKVADPDALDPIEDEQKKLRASLRNLRSLADGVYVKVQIGLANNKGELNRPAISNLVSWLLQQRDVEQGKVSMVQVMGKDLQEGEVELDFIRAQIGDTKTLSLGQIGPDENYKRRIDFLGECMDDHYSTLKKFKPKD